MSVNTDKFVTEENMGKNGSASEQKPENIACDTASELAENSKIGEGSAGAQAENNSQSDNSEVLTAEDVKELAPMYSNVVLALKQVYDPEIPVNIYDLGLIYELNINKAKEVYIKMTFTAPNCPMADEVLHNVQTSVEDVPGVTKCTIELVFEPAWDRSMLSEEARLELGLDDDIL